MDIFTDGFYELEFQRLYRQQGRVLFRIKQLENQLISYITKQNSLQAHGISSAKLQGRINLTRSRLDRQYILRDRIEADKDTISLNRPWNKSRQIDARVISDAYERAYAPAQPQLPANTKHGIWAALLKCVNGRTK